MTFGNPNRGDLDSGDQPQRSAGPVAPTTPGAETGRMRLPIARPIITYVLLGLIVLAFLADLAANQFAGGQIVTYLGAQVNSWVGAGEYWRLLSAIFLHAGLTHLAFNGYALFILGRDIEGFFGSRWFTVIYLLSGLAGSVAWYVLGSDAPSVGASGAIFGLIGAEAAFFLRNRQLFGAFARQRLSNLAIMIVINLVFGFTVPNINNLAHLGGLTAGFVLGFALSPSYTISWSPEEYTQPRRLVDSRSQGQRVLFALATLVVLLGLVLVGNQRWAS